MNILITNFIGVILTVMIFFNAKLTDNLGMFYALICIHIVGLLGAIFFSLITKTKISYNKNIKFYYYLGGAFGVLTVVSNSLSFFVIGGALTATISLLGQTIASIISDIYGIGGSEKKPFKKNKLLGISVIIIGIILMEVY